MGAPETHRRPSPSGLPDMGEPTAAFGSPIRHYRVAIGVATTPGVPNGWFPGFETGVTGTSWSRPLRKIDYFQHLGGIGFSLQTSVAATRDIPVEIVTSTEVFAFKLYQTE